MNGVFSMFKKSLLSLTIAGLVAGSVQAHCPCPTSFVEETDDDRMAGIIAGKLNNCEDFPAFFAVVSGLAAIPTVAAAGLSIAQLFLTPDGSKLFDKMFSDNKIFITGVIGSYITMIGMVFYAISKDDQKKYTSLLKKMAQRLGLENHKYLQRWFAEKTE
jgi:hypothetical protein